ncbi:MAG: DEAD/DEAH box helicase [Candidatus Viridilinea halotolerans]|uniref:DEAD/DEAH box helicase n=1 Tax=Candidatus Viridilinea halotolerans TaxID=2491704 RepID=A0A426UCN6_9CHLR|nr:MAG: DEAD/DEAH box helicase [Candidatus Viridilinea halotolerans]
MGSDLHAWHLAALLSLELVAGQAYIPTLRREGRAFVAAWQPRPTPALAQKLGLLARNMPPLCRAVTPSLEAAPLPRALLDAFLAAATHALVRTFAEADPALAERLVRWQQPKATPGARWLAALFGPEPNLALEGRPAEELFQAWQTWAGQEHVAGDEHFRITFRLEAPEEEQQPWQLSYLLQAHDDPSLLVPAAQLWRERGQFFSYLDRRFAHPQERLLRGLGFASRLCPPIERSLHSQAPEQATLDSTEAFHFLKEVAPLLEQSGFGVLVPAWWGNAGQLRARMQAGVKKKQKGKGKDSEGRISFHDLVRFDWEMSIGDEPIDRAEFERLVALKQPLVRVRGQWVALDPAQMQRALALFKHGGEMPLFEALRIGLEGSTPTLPDGVAFAGIEADGALGNLLRNLVAFEQIEPIPQPDTFVGQLRPYQQRGLAWLSFMQRLGLGACLADDMGLGKSPQTIALLLHDYAQRPQAGPTLLISPTSVVGNWQRELARFAPTLRVLVHQGTERRRGAALTDALPFYDVVISSYPLLARDREDLAAITWRMVVLDEAQNIKNSETRQAQAARAMHAENRVALTGTPVENRLTELWSIMSFLNPGYLGGETEFRRSFARPIERAGDSQAAERLRRLTAPFVLRRLKTDSTIINDLPPKHEMKVFVPLTKEQATLYQATVSEALQKVDEATELGDEIKRRGIVLAMLTRLKQICNHPANFLQDGSAVSGRSGKLNRLEEMLEELLTAGDRALIFTQFSAMGTLLQSYLRERLANDILFLHGATPAKQRDVMVRQFQAPHGPNIFILSLKAGGVGLNLTRANHVFHFDRWWNPAVEDQATDRAFRIGQTQRVQVHKFVCGGTLEEQIDAMIESKRALAAQVLGSGEGWLTELNTNQLRDLVALRDTAMAEE